MEISYLTRTGDLKLDSQSGCRPSGNGCGRLHYLTRSENLRQGDGCDVVLAEMPMMHA